MSLKGGRKNFFKILFVISEKSSQLVSEGKNLTNLENRIAQTPDVVFWASVYKAICGVKDTPEAIVSKAKAWLHEHGMSPNLAG